MPNEGCMVVLYIYLCYVTTRPQFGNNSPLSLQFMILLQPPNQCSKYYNVQQCSPCANIPTFNPILDLLTDNESWPHKANIAHNGAFSSYS